MQQFYGSPLTFDENPTFSLSQNAGIHWSPAIAGFLALACLPFPYVFAHYGAQIRERCRYAKEAAETLKLMQNAGRKDPEVTSEVEGEASGVDQSKEEAKDLSK